MISILNYTDRSPVDLVSVYTDNKSFSAISDEFGKVTLKGLSQSTKINFQHPSFYNETFTLKEIQDKGNKILLVEKIVMIDEVVLSADKSAENKSEISNQLDIIYQSEIAFKNPQTSADMLSESGHVFIQKSQMGGGSPIIRGFEANKVLLVIDGVRMNNAIYRGGHLQNVITIDNNIIERTEVILGPGSLIYGSDALGGVMHFYTKSPLLSKDGKAVIKANAMSRYASANNEKTVHLDFSIASKKIGLLSSITFSDFDNLRAGENRNPFHDDWGLSKIYPTTENGIDSFTINDNPNVQTPTAYHQYDILEKLLYKVNEDLEMSLNFQFSNSSDIPRYDRISEIDDAMNTIGIKPVYARWDYGPQKRILASYSLTARSKGKLFDNLNLVTAFQNINEERITRRYRESDETRRKENVKVANFNLDLKKKIEKNVIYYGMEYTFNDVQSSAERENLEDGSLSVASTRYPDEGSNTHSIALYVKNKTAVSDRIFISAGMRINNSILKAKFGDIPIDAVDFSEINISNLSATGALDVIYNAAKNWRLNLLLSTGFRAPNVDDVGKIFDPAPGIVVVPNDDLKSEYVYSAEIGVQKRFTDKLELSATTFVMLVTDLIKRSEFAVNGMDSIVYDGVESQIFANTNTDEAIITGFSADLKADLHPIVSLSSSINYTYGQDISNEEPLAHIPPIYGKTELALHKGGFKGIFSINYQGWKMLERYSPNNDDKLDQATEEGSPAWFMLNSKASYQFNKIVGLQFGVENILDKHYRPFASGISAAGRNYIVAIRVKV
ncbi:MAG: TonB-dependent receptor [Chitinophagales bacterium]|nr:TonB-dependent receptor [Chitinophagales bacterium]